MNALEHIGEAQAAMMLIGGKLRNIEPSLQPRLWLWARLDEPLENTLESINYLVEQGYQQTSIEMADACIESQLYDVKRVVESGPGPVTGDHIVQRWYKPTERPYVPVMLTYTVPNDKQYAPQQSIPMLNPLPLPQHGEYALVVHQGDHDLLYAYSINALPLEARQRWSKMGEALRALAAPSLWPAADERHRLASNPVEYQRAINQLTARIRVAQGEEKAKANATNIHLGAAKIQVDDLRKAFSKPSWLKDWQEIQRMAQELAGDYYAHHLNTIGTTDSAPAPEPVEVQSDVPMRVNIADEPAPIEEPEPPKKKRGRRPRTDSVPIVAKGKDTISMKSDIINREIINALRDKNTYNLVPEQNLAEHTHRFYQKDKGQIIITIRPLEGESWETVLHALNTLGDGCIDTYIAVMAIAIDKNGTEHVRMPFQVSPDDILAVCKKEKSNGSYTPWQRADVTKHLKTLSQARVIATMPGQPPTRRGGKKVSAGTTLRAEGALLDLLSFKIGEYNTITGEEIWERRSIAVGEWATMIPELNGKTATMLRQVLKYSAKNERYQKRLGVYLTFMFRINARHGGRFPNDISMGALLEGAGIVAPREQGQFREAIERALERLKQDCVIGDYWRVVEDTPQAQQIDREIHEHARGWFASYLQQKWNFSPPEHIKEQYRKMLKAAPEGGQ